MRRGALRAQERPTTCFWPGVRSVVSYLIAITQHVPGCRNTAALPLAAPCARLSTQEDQAAQIAGLIKSPDMPPNTHSVGAHRNICSFTPPVSKPTGHPRGRSDSCRNSLLAHSHGRTLVAWYVTPGWQRRRLSRTASFGYRRRWRCVTWARCLSRLASLSLLLLLSLSSFVCIEAAMNCNLPGLFWWRTGLEVLPRACWRCRILVEGTAAFPPTDPQIEG